MKVSIDNVFYQKKKGIDDVELAKGIIAFNFQQSRA